MIALIFGELSRTFTLTDNLQGLFCSLYGIKSREHLGLQIDVYFSELFFVGFFNVNAVRLTRVRIAILKEAESDISYSQPLGSCFSPCCKALSGTSPCREGESLNLPPLIN